MASEEKQMRLGPATQAALLSRMLSCCRLPRREEHHTLALREISVPGDRSSSRNSIADAGTWFRASEPTCVSMAPGKAISKKHRFGDARLRPAPQVANSALRSTLRAGGLDVTPEPGRRISEEAAMPGHQFAGHEPEFPRRFTLERIASNAKSPVSSARKQARALTE